MADLYLTLTDDGLTGSEQAPTDVAADQVVLTDASGDVVTFSVSSDRAGVGYLMTDQGVLVVRVHRGGEVLRTYSPSGWRSIEGSSPAYDAKPAATW
ncbi:hypothetical protein ACPPVT_01635 [Angustibacter sp. McL0619]|uniref:hypothetical protein n=1 Tax=Angustibacter sp. McL0619 TaxID=3415676 RepID=UPI003CF34271